MKFVLATHNQYKKLEFEDLAKTLGVLILDNPVQEEPLETGKTFVENALIKARHTSGFVDTWVMAEDSGLCVPTLGGKPGIYSARFAGSNAQSKDNIIKLQELLQTNDLGEKVYAYYYAIIVLLQHPNDPQPIIEEGIMQGYVTTISQQKFDGFGYDPIFIPSGEKQQLSQLPKEYKQKHSHRKLAFQRVVDKFKMLKN